MRRAQIIRNLLAAGLLAAGMTVGATATAGAETITVDVGPGARPLAEVIAQAAPGSTLRLLDGVHEGPVTIAKPLSIIAQSRAATIRGLSLIHI